MGLILVLAGIAIVAGLVIPAYFARPSVTLDRAALLLARELRTTQNWAALSGRKLSVLFHDDGDGWAVVDPPTATVVDRPDGNGPFQRIFPADGVFEGVRVVEAQFAGAPMITYNQRGMAEQGGHVVLSFRGEERIVRVAASSGLLRIEGLARDWVDDGL